MGSSGMSNLIARTRALTVELRDFGNAREVTRPACPPQPRIEEGVEAWEAYQRSRQPSSSRESAELSAAFEAEFVERVRAVVRDYESLGHRSLVTPFTVKKVVNTAQFWEIVRNLDKMAATLEAESASE